MRLPTASPERRRVVGWDVL